MLVHHLPITDTYFPILPLKNNTKIFLETDDSKLEMTLSPKGVNELVVLHFGIGILAGFLGGYALFSGIILTQLIWLFIGISLFGLSSYFLSKGLNYCCNSHKLSINEDQLVIEHDHWLWPCTVSIPTNMIKDVCMDNSHSPGDYRQSVATIILPAYKFAFFEEATYQDAFWAVQNLRHWLQLN